MIGNAIIIAEVKTKSPFGWSSNEPWDRLFAIADDIGDIVAVHTDPRWAGSFDLVRKAANETGKPILAKGIHADDSLVDKAFKAGATWVLAVGRIPMINPSQCLIEADGLSELSAINTDLRAVWNSRNLNNGKPKQETFDQARLVFKGWLCQASNLKTVADIHPFADAVLVGTNLVMFAESIKGL